MSELRRWGIRCGNEKTSWTVFHFLLTWFWWIFLQFVRSLQGRYGSYNDETLTERQFTESMVMLDPVTTSRVRCTCGLFYPFLDIPP